MRPHRNASASERAGTSAAEGGRYEDSVKAARGLYVVFPFRYHNPMPYEFLEHTADIRVACAAPDMPALLATAADAMYAVALDRREESISTSRDVILEVHSHEELVVRWLQELMYMLDTERFVAAQYHWPQIDWTAFPLALTATVAGYICDSQDRDEEIKAITYHGLNVEKTPRGYHAEIVFDI